MEPIKLEHRIKGSPPHGPNGFRYANGCVLYPEPTPVTTYKWVERSVTPTPAQWEHLWRVCDEIDLWFWPSTVGNLNVYDGVSWTTELQVGARQVKIQGQLVGAEEEYVPKLFRLHRAVQALTGWVPTPVMQEEDGDVPPVTRDPARIDRILEKLRRIWLRYPNERFGQMFGSVSRISQESSRALFYMQDEELDQRLDEWLSQWEQKPSSSG